MRTSTLIARPAKWRTRTGRTSGSCWARTLENGLTANYATLRTTTSLPHRPAGLSMKLRTGLALCCRLGRWRSVNRTRAGLRRNHAPLRNNGLARRRLRRSCRGNRRSCRLRRHGRCRFAYGSGHRRSFRRRCNNHRWRLSLCRRRSNHHCGRRSRLFNFFLRWRSRWRRDNRRRLPRRGHNHRTLSRWYWRLARGFFRYWRLRRNWRRRLRLGLSRSRSR